MYFYFIVLLFTLALSNRLTRPLRPSLSFPTAGYHALNYSMFELAAGYRARGMSAYSELQAKEFAAEAAGYTGVRHQREAATGYFDAVSDAITGGASSTTALNGSTEAAQF